MTKDNQLADGHIHVYSTSGPERQTVKVLQGMEMIRTKKWSGEPWEDPKDGWDSIVPEYRAQQDLAPFPRSREAERPFSSDNLGLWQYATKPIKAGEIVKTTCWPHPTLSPLNRSARAVYRYFMEVPRVSMAPLPWRDGKVCLPSMSLRNAQIKRPSELHQPDAA